MVRNFRLTTVYFIFFLGFQAHASNGCYLQSYINHNCFRFVAPDFVNSAVGPCVPSDAYTIRESLKKKGYYFIVMNNTNAPLPNSLDKNVLNFVMSNF